MTSTQKNILKVRLLFFLSLKNVIYDQKESIDHWKIILYYIENWWAVGECAGKKKRCCIAT